jgi:hypothetical protein
MTVRAPTCHGSWRMGQRIERATIPFGSLIPSSLRPLSRVFPALAFGLFYFALIGAQPARAQCTANPANGGVLQNGGAPCTVNTPVTVGFGTAVSATNSANVTTNAAVTANGFGTGIDATTEIAPETPGHGLPLGKCEAYNRGRCKSRSDQAAVHDRDCL